MLLAHITGSTLFSIHSLPYATVSGILAALLGIYEAQIPWLRQAISHPTAFIGPFNFLVSFIIVYRSQLAITRFREALNGYTIMCSKLYDMASFIKSFCYASDYKLQSQSDLVQAKIFRWIRLYHKIALGRLLGKKFTEIQTCKQDDLIEPDEYAILLKTRLRARTVMSWIEQAVSLYPEVFPAPAPLNARIYAIATEINSNYQICTNIGELPFPFPYTQIAILVLHVWMVFTPFMLATYLDAISGCIISFTSTWILFALNESAFTLENPFDGRQNDLPLRYFEHTFVSELNTIEFSAQPLFLQHPRYECPPEEVGDEASHKTCTPSASYSAVNGYEHATRELPVDTPEESSFRRFFRNIGICHDHSGTEELIRDPYGNPIIIRAGYRFAVIA